LDAAVVDYVNLVHNHPLLSPEEAKNHRSHKVKDPGFLQYIDQLQDCNVPPASVSNIIREMHGGAGNVPFTKRDLQIGKPCCFKVIGDDAAYNVIDYLFWLCKQESRECEGGKCE
jgi:hypothetical protein